RRRHLAHRDQARGALQLAILFALLLLDQMAPRGVGGDEQLDEAAVDPSDLPYAQVEPAIELGVEDLGGRALVAGLRVRLEQLLMAPTVGTEQAAVHPVGEQQLGAVPRTLGRARDGYRRVELVEHGGETL